MINHLLVIFYSSLFYLIKQADKNGDLNDTRSRKNGVSIESCFLPRLKVKHVHTRCAMKSTEQCIQLALKFLVMLIGLGESVTRDKQHNDEPFPFRLKGATH